MTSKYRDPSNFVFNEEEEELIKKHMDEQNAQLIDMNENLATDKVRVPSQNYALISIVSSTQTTQKSNKTCVKLWGVFDTIENANQHAARIMKVDPIFDIMIVWMYEWLMVPTWNG